MITVPGLRVNIGLTSKHDGCAENMATLAAQYSLQRHRHCADCAWLTVRPQSDVHVSDLARFSAGASSVFEAAENKRAAVSAPPAPPPPPPHKALLTHRLLTFFLSHAFVLPGATEQHQPHSLSDTTLRERASRLWSTDNRRVRPPQQPARRSCCCASVAPCGSTRSFFLHVSAALHSRQPLTNEAARPGRGRDRAANQEQPLVN